jgi:MFS family permease
MAHRGMPFRTLVPARLDRLPWSPFHWKVVIALGITWVIDGLEVTLTGAISGVLRSEATLHFTSGEIGQIASFYVIGAVAGALLFGHLTDLMGRKKLFFITLAVYLSGTFLTAFSWDLWSFIAFRLITGAGIGGEYSAINSAVDELIPARVRGQIDLIVNGSYWLGAAVGALGTLVLLDPHVFPVDIGWRVGFGIGACIGLFILFYRKSIPESPRWLMTHGREEEAEEVVKAIEAEIEERTGKPLPLPVVEIAIHPGREVNLRTVAKAVFGRYRRRSVLCLALMISQSFLYNAIFFTYSLVLITFYRVPESETGLYLLPFAISNFLGPLLLGRLFDTVGRRQLISATYLLSALLLLLTGWLFVNRMLSAVGQTVFWSFIFFFASCAASSAYLTVSEIFPLEIRALSIALFFSIGSAAGGVAAPWLFGVLIGTASRLNVAYGYMAASALMIAAAIIEAIYGVKAERVPLERVAEPLSTEA